MSISPSEFNALSVGDTVYLYRSYDFKRAYKGIISRITKTTKVAVIGGNSEFGFLSPTRQRGERIGCFNLVTEREYVDALLTIKREDNLRRVQRALYELGKLTVRDNNGDAILMALADATAKAEIFYK